MLETSEFHLQFAYNFNLKKTVNLQETLKWLSQMTLAIQRKLKIQMKQNKPLKFRMSLEDFISNNKKSSNNIGDIFQNMLGNVKECGKQACNSIFEKYKTPLVFFKALTNIETESEKLEMLSLKARKANKNLQNEKNDDINLRITLAKRLVVLFCEENYPDFVNYSDKEDVDGLF